MDRDLLSPAEIDEAPLDGWSPREGALHVTYRTGDFATGVRLVNAIAEAAERVNHHPDIDLHYADVTVHLWSHDAGGVTRRDIALAQEISQLAQDLGIPPS